MKGKNIVTAILLLFVIYALTRIRVSAPVPEAERSAFVPMTRTSQVVLEMDPRVEHDEQLIDEKT